MKWKHYRYLLQLTRRQFFRTLSSSSSSSSATSSHKFPATAISLAEKTHDRNQHKNHNFTIKRQVILTNELVHSTLLNCPSDLLALSFFLWCAKQPNFFHNAMAFDYMVGVMTRLMKRFETVIGILGGLESVGNVIKAQTFLLLLRIYWRGEMYELVFEAFEQMGHCGFSPNTFARNVIIDVLFKIGRADVALKFFRETSVPNFLTFNIVLCNLSKLKDLVGIRDVFRCMVRIGYYPNPGTFEVVLNCFGKMGKLMEAYQVLGLMTTFGISMSVNVWTIIVDGLCRLHRVADASCLVKKMEKTGCSPNIVTYTTLIKGCMDAQLVSRAFGVLNMIKSNGHSLDRILCNVLIDSLAKIGSYDDALDLFLSLNKLKIFPDSYTFSSLLKTICLSKRFFLLPQLVNGFSVEVDLVVCNSLLSYFCKAGFPYLALELYYEMLDKGVMPDKYSILGLLNGLCRSKRIDEAVHLYNGILLNCTVIDPHIHTVVIDGLIKAGKCHSAIRIFRKVLLEEYPLDVVSYTVAIRGLLRVGRTTEAGSLYNHMKEAGITPDVHICNLMLFIFCKEKNFQTLKQMLQEMIDLRVEVSCNNILRLCNVLYKSNNSHLVTSLLIEMRDLGLLPADLACKVSIHEPSGATNVIEKQYKLSDGCSEYGLYTDISGSEECDVAASVG